MKLNPGETMLATQAVGLMNYYQKLSKDFFRFVAENETDCKLSDAKFEEFLIFKEKCESICYQNNNIKRDIDDAIKGLDAFPYEKLKVHLGKLCDSSKVILENIPALEKVEFATEKGQFKTYSASFLACSKRATPLRTICESLQDFASTPQLPVLAQDRFIPQTLPGMLDETKFVMNRVMYRSQDIGNDEQEKDGDAPRG